MTLKEYKSGSAFNGVIGRTFDQSGLARTFTRQGGCS